jgi:hypothetical protein
VAEPSISAYLPEPGIATGAAVVICPGGVFHFVPLPTDAAWLNLIDGFWKILRQPTPFLWGRRTKPRRQLKRQYLYRI